MDPNFDPYMLTMWDKTQFNQQLNHILMLWEVKTRQKEQILTFQILCPILSLVGKVYSSLTGLRKATKEKRVHFSLCATLSILEQNGLNVKRFQYLS